MRRALELAAQGIGRVEPNPAVGAVIVDENLNLLGEGFHQRYGGPHAEIHALRQAGEKARGGVMFVTLEPCCHHGQTGPCSTAVIDAGIRKVMVAVQDPFPKVAGGGLAALRGAGVEVEVGLLAEEAQRLNAPFWKRVTRGLPYVHAKWAMTLDGRIATRKDHSQWISGPESRQIVHSLRGRMDGILIGRGTAVSDDPLLTARPAGPRIASRIVVDSQARLPVSSQLVQTADQWPVIVAATSAAAESDVRRLQDAGVEVLTLPGSNSSMNQERVDLTVLLQQLSERGMTNLLAEGGGELLGSLFDTDLIDEYHVFIAPKLAGGSAAVSPLAGLGKATISDRPDLHGVSIRQVGEDVYWHGFAATSPRID